MSVRYYVTLFPTESLVASMHEPQHFGTYMATGDRKGSAEQLIFAEVEPGFDGFDWEAAEKACVPHANGSAKNSVYLSIYRVLEKVPLDKIKSLYLTTRDGRSLELKPANAADVPKVDYHVFQEMCPVHPLVVSSKSPADFAKYITKENTLLHVPAIAFADLKTLNFNDLEHTGNIGALYDSNVRHLKKCVDDVTASGKATKVIDRSHIESFTFNIIKTGVYIGDGETLLYFAMPTIEELKQINYDWGRSALIL